MPGEVCQVVEMPQCGSVAQVEAGGNPAETRGKPLAWWGTQVGSLTVCGKAVAVRSSGDVSPSLRVVPKESTTKALTGRHSSS